MLSEPRLGLRLGDLCRCHPDYGRGLIIGEPTFGKGTVQNLVDLDAVTQQEKPIFGELKMTIAQFFRANGGSTHLRGVTGHRLPGGGEAKDFGDRPTPTPPALDFHPGGRRLRPVADLKGVIPR